jgi:hypothetical protein
MCVKLNNLILFYVNNESDDKFSAQKITFNNEVLSQKRFQR